MKYLLPQNIKTELAQLAVYGDTISPGQLCLRLTALVEEIKKIKVVTSDPS